MKPANPRSPTNSAQVPANCLLTNCAACVTPLGPGLAIPRKRGEFCDSGESE